MSARSSRTSAPSGTAATRDDSEPSPALVARGLTVRHHGSQTAALCDVDVRVERGQSVALLGANGSGKSTFLAVVTGELAPARGTCEVAVSVAAVGQAEQLRLDVPVTARSLALMGAYHRTGLLRRVSRSDRQLAEASLARVGLGDLGHRPIGELSGGQRQRALLARALVHGGELLALDEPLAAIDPGSAQLIHEVLEQERGAGRTLLVATHDLNELHRWDRVLVLAGGRAIAFAAPGDLPPDVLESAYGQHGAHGHGPCDHLPAP